MTKNYGENMIVGASKDMLNAYSDNCEGIYAGGDTIDEVKADTEEAIRLIKKNLPEERWPEQIKGEYELEWRFDVPSFLEYVSGRYGENDRHQPEATVELP